MPLSPTLAGRRFYWASMLTALAIGGLQMFRIPAGVLTDYGADVFGTAWLYAMTRLGWTVFQRGRPAGTNAAAAVIFALCTLSEVGQRVHLVPGHFDPYDIVAFAAGIAACLACERVLGPFVDAPQPR